MRKPASRRSIGAGTVRCIAALLALIAATDIVAQPKELPLPVGVTATIVGEDMVVNGIPLSAYEYYWTKGSDALIQEYQRLWQGNSDGGAPALIVSRLGDWSLLSHVENGLNYSVQYREEGIKGLRVLLGVSPLPNMLTKKRRPSGKSNMQIPQGMNVLSTVRSIDRGRVSETFWLESRGSVNKTARVIDQHFSRLGYTVKQSDIEKSSSDQGATLINIHAVSGEDRIDFSLMASGSASKVIAVRRGL